MCTTDVREYLSGIMSSLCSLFSSVGHKRKQQSFDRSRRLSGNTYE